MSAIIDGAFVRGTGAEKAMGGTELMALRMIKHIDPELLKRFNVILQRVDDAYISTDKPNILVLQDLPEDRSAQHLRDRKLRRRFAKICPVSDWQAQGYNFVLGVPYDEMKVIRNMIEPIDSTRGVDQPDPIRIVYHTTPHRGLEILVRVFYALAEMYPNIELHLYSSFKIYGRDERDNAFAGVFADAEAHPRIFNHGTVSNEEIRRILPTMDIYAYPSIWKETSSLSTIEALAAGCHVVTPNLASLPETTLGYAHMYDFAENIDVHANRFGHALSILIWKMSSPPHFKELARHQAAQSSFVNDYYSVNRVLRKWHALFSELASRASWK